MDRRQFLTLTFGGSSAMLAGCGESGRTKAADAWRNVSKPTVTSGAERTGDLHLPTGRFATYSFQGSAKIRLVVKAHAKNGRFDVLTLSAEEFDAYRRGDDPRPIERASRFDANPVSIDVTLPAGSYELVFDNTAFGEADGEGEVVADYLVRIEVG